MKQVIFLVVFIFSISATASVEQQIAATYSHQFLQQKVNSYLEDYLNDLGTSELTTPLPHLGTHAVQGISFLLAGYNLTQGKTDRDRFWGMVHAGAVIHPAIGLYALGAQLSEMVLGASHSKKMMAYQRAIATAIEEQIRADRARIEMAGKVYVYHLKGFQESAVKMMAIEKDLDLSPTENNQFQQNQVRITQWLQAVSDFQVASHQMLYHMQYLKIHQESEVSQLFGRLGFDIDSLALDIRLKSENLKTAYHKTLATYSELLVGLSLNKSFSGGTSDSLYDLCHRKRLRLRTDLLRQVSRLRKSIGRKKLLSAQETFESLENSRSQLTVLQSGCQDSGDDQDLLGLFERIENILYSEIRGEPYVAG